MTEKQKRVAKDLLENRGKPVSQAMLDAGYSPAMAKNPQTLTQSKAWQELMEEYLPDAKLFEKHQEALEATKWNDFTGEREADHGTRLKAVDMAYKLKGRGGDRSQLLQQINIGKDDDGGNKITFVNFKHDTASE